jgi:hypothetical protein
VNRFSAFLLAFVAIAFSVALVPGAAAQPADSTDESPDARQHDDRLFLKPTARPVGKGAVTISLVNVFLPELSVGLTEAASVEASVLMVPGAVGDLYTVWPRVRLLRRSRLQLSADVRAMAVRETGIFFGGGHGFEVRTLSDWRYVAIPRAVATYGTEAASVTASIGVPFSTDNRYNDVTGAGAVVLSGGGAVQVLSWLALLTDNDLALGVPYRVVAVVGGRPDQGSGGVQLGYATGTMSVVQTVTGVRLGGGAFAVDLGGGVLAASRQEFDLQGAAIVRFSYRF